MQLFLCSAFFSFSPSMTRRQKFYFLPRLRNQENGVLQGNKVSYSIESWKWGIFRQRQLFCNRKISSVLGCPAFSTGFPHSTVCSPSGRGGHFCPSTSLAAYFRAKMPTPALMAAYCFMRKTSSSCRATNYIQFFSLLQSFFSVYIHHISVILLNKRTFLRTPLGNYKVRKLNQYWGERRISRENGVVSCPERRRLRLKKIVLSSTTSSSWDRSTTRDKKNQWNFLKHMN